MYQIFYFIVTTALLSNIAVSAQVSNRKLGGQNFSGEITINQSTAEVWKVLTDMQKISKIMGYEYKGAVKFSKPGNQAQIKIWGDTGTYILVYSKPFLRTTFYVGS